MSGMDESPSRRRVLALLGTTGLGASAGCLWGSSDSNHVRRTPVQWGNHYSFSCDGNAILSVISIGICSTTSKRYLSPLSYEW